jgi:hypothetical protein
VSPDFLVSPDSWCPRTGQKPEYLRSLQKPIVISRRSPTAPIRSSDQPVFRFTVHFEPASSLRTIESPLIDEILRVPKRAHSEISQYLIFFRSTTSLGW